MVQIQKEKNENQTLLSKIKLLNNEISELKIYKYSDVLEQNQ